MTRERGGIPENDPFLGRGGQTRARPGLNKLVIGCDGMARLLLLRVTLLFFLQLVDEGVKTARLGLGGK